MDFLESIIDTTVSSFDFSFCASVNILTYIIIKILDDINGDKKVKTIYKRLALIASILIVGGAFYITGSDMRLLLNSAILAPVFWSWIAKPVCDKLNIGYKKEEVEQ